MDLFSVNLFEETDKKVSATSKEEEEIQKLKAFADVEDTEDSVLKKHVAAKEIGVQLDFDANEEVLEDILSTKPKVEPKNFNSVQTKVQGEQKPLHGESEDKQTTNPRDEEPSSKVTSGPENLDSTLDSIDEIGEKAALKLVGGVRLACKRLKILAAYALSDYQDKKIHRRFEKGEHVIAGDFEFLLQNNELMVFKYRSTSPHVLIPDCVGNLPVKYVYKGFLNRNIFDNHKVRSFISYFSEENVADLSLDSLKDSCAGIKSLQFPKELVYVPRKLFSGMKLIKTVIIPDSVKLLSPSTFSKSYLENVYFEGDVPKNLHLVMLPAGCHVFCKEYYAVNYEKQFARRDVFYDRVEGKEVV